MNYAAHYYNSKWMKAMAGQSSSISLNCHYSLQILSKKTDILISQLRLHQNKTYVNIERITLIPITLLKAIMHLIN